MDMQAVDFTPGTTVIYPMHGKCTLLSIENRQIAGENIPFYKLEIQRSSFSRSTRQEPAIWVPVHAARERGLRLPITPSDVETIMSILSNREYYFDPNESWTTVLPRLEACMRTEGASGLAKVHSYLFVLKRKQVVPTTEVTRTAENVTKLLLRELSEVTGETIRTLEERIAKKLRQKLIPDT